MAWYKYDWAVEKFDSAAYDATYHPETPAPHAGIYRCIGCGREIGIADGHELPPQNHHQHPPGSPPILWRLTVNADGRPKAPVKT